MAGAAGREVLFEVQRVGRAMRVTAVDAATGIEATVVGDGVAGEMPLRRLALRKLDRLMARQPS